MIKFYLNQCEISEEIGTLAIELEDGRIEYIKSDNVIQQPKSSAILENKTKENSTPSKYQCTAPNCLKEFSSNNHLKVS